MQFTDKSWLPILNVWHAGQVALPEVVRWKKYIDCGLGARRQDSLAHSYSIAFLAQVLLEKLRAHIALDGELLMTAALVHDLGEGAIGQDTLYIDKSVDIDLCEYGGFVKCFEQFPSELFERFHRAFLLQFALRNPENFPSKARTVMEELAREKHMEALAFGALESWDYLLYAIEQYCKRGNVKILVQVLRNQLPCLRDLATLLPGFGTEVFTPELYDWFVKFMHTHEGKWIE